MKSRHSRQFSTFHNSSKPKLFFLSNIIGIDPNSRSAIFRTLQHHLRPKAASQYSLHKLYKYWGYLRLDSKGGWMALNFFMSTWAHTINIGVRREILVNWRHEDWKTASNFPKSSIFSPIQKLSFQASFLWGQPRSINCNLTFGSCGSCGCNQPEFEVT